MTGGDIQNRRNGKYEVWETEWEGALEQEGGNRNGNVVDGWECREVRKAILENWMKIKDEKQMGWKWNDSVVSYKEENPSHYLSLFTQHPVYTLRSTTHKSTLYACHLLAASVLKFHYPKGVCCVNLPDYPLF